MNAESIRKEVLQADPRFNEALEKHDELSARIDVMKRELAVKESQINQQIDALRKELDRTRKTVATNVDKTKSLLNPFVERVDLALSLADEELKSKRGERATIGHRISSIRKALKRTQPAWSEQERANMDRDLDELLNETKRLGAEIAALQQHIRLLKLKRVLLRL